MGEDRNVNGVIESQEVDAGPSPHVLANRKPVHQDDFNVAFQAVRPPKRQPTEVARKALRKYCSWERLRKCVFGTFPIFGWLLKYDLKNDLVSDVVAGVTVAIFQVPQAMGYAMLATVGPVVGLYTSFFPPLVYSIMGTSRQNAVGTYAVIALMAGSAITKLTEDATVSISNNTITSTETWLQDDTPNTTDIPVTTATPNIVGPTVMEAAMVVTLVVGCYQVLFGLLRLGMLSVYMSEALISGFTCASAIQVFTTQLGNFFNIEVGNYSGALSLMWSYKDFFVNLVRTNLVVMAISLVSLCTLIVVKELIDPWSRKKIKIPIPIELIIVILGTSISHALQLENEGIKIVGAIPVGFPSFQQPMVSLIPAAMVPSLPIAVISYTSTLSLAKLFATKHSYEVDANQEAIGLGACNIFSSFFSCIPSSGSLSRSSLQDSMGGKTQVVSLVNCAIFVLVLLVAGPLLKDLPKCILSTIVMVALRNMLLMILEFRRYWKVSKIDGAIWMVTFLSAVILDINMGLAAGVGFSILTLVYRSQRPKCYLLGMVDYSDVYVPVKRYLKAIEIPGIKIFYFAGPLHFANVEYFRSQLERCTGTNMRDLLAKGQRTTPDDDTSVSIGPALQDSINNLVDLASLDTVSVTTADWPTHIIIDCSGFSFVDTAGVVMLKRTLSDYKHVGIRILLACCSTSVYNMLEKEGFLSVSAKSDVFPTIHDAVLHSSMWPPKASPDAED